MISTESVITEADLWREAYGIAYVGASNPVAVARRLADLTAAWRHTATEAGMGTPKHVALRAIAGHLAFLHGQGLGPELDDLRAVQSHAHVMGIDPAHTWRCRYAAPVKIAGAITGWTEYETCACGERRSLPA